MRCKVAAWSGLLLLLALSSMGRASGSSADGSVDPLQVFEAASQRVVVDASTRRITFSGIPLAEAKSVVGACVVRERLFVAQRDGVVLVYDLPDPMTDGPPLLVQRLENVGRQIRGIVAAPLVERAIVLASGSLEVLGIGVYDETLIVEGEVDEPAFVDHARFLDFLRDEDGAASTPLHLALGPQRLALVTDGEILELFHLDRSYRVLARSPWPEGVARIESIAYTGSHWILTGLNENAEPVLMQSTSTAGPWSDAGVSELDAALAGDGQPKAWLPGRLTIASTHVRLAIRGERAAVASWPRSSEKLEADGVEIQWLSASSP